MKAVITNTKGYVKRYSKEIEKIDPKATLDEAKDTMLITLKDLNDLKILCDELDKEVIVYSLQDEGLYLEIYDTYRE